uniref:Uncharacterized protein n=1 Tax=Oryza sativa subsp. japonica TaxID=39947 RepID=Q6ZBT4_ORYSJ|nr:hypothetical protein [Oryza sativa Japonica Group]BAD05233.1 hypothetical protein [Oryza sativa Japonica Group]
MARPGDLANRLDSIQRCIPWSTAVREEEGLLSRSAAVVRITGVYLLTCTLSTLSDSVVAASPFSIEDINFSVKPCEFRQSILDEGCLVQDLEEPKTETKTACLCAWIWSEDPDAIPKAVHFQLEEPLLQNSPDSFWLEDLGESGLERRRTVSSKLLTYQVLIHLDQVLDSSPPPMEPVWGYSPSSQGSGMISSASVTEEVPKRHDIIWSLGVKDGQRAPREHVAARLGPGRNRSHSCSRSPPAHEHRRPSGWDVPPARTTAPTRRSSSRPPDHRGGSYGGYQRAATSPVRRERTRSPRNRQSPPPAPRPLVPQTASPPPPPSEGLTEFRPQESQIVPFPLTTPFATVLQVDQLANSIAGFDAPMMAIPLSVDPMLEEVGLGNIAPPPEQSLEQPQAQPPEQLARCKRARLQRSARLAKKVASRLAPAKPGDRAQEDLMKKAGLISPDGKKTDQAMTKYVKLFKQPLSAEVIDAFSTLVAGCAIGDDKKPK